MIRLFARKHRAVFLFFSVSEHPPLSVGKWLLFNFNKDCSEMKIKIFPINQTTFVLINIFIAFISKSLNRNALFVLNNDDHSFVFITFLFSAIVFFAQMYTVYARVLDANKSINIAHFILVVNILAIFSDTLLGLCILVSFVFWAASFFFEESLVIVIKYFDEEKAVKKIKKCKVFPKNEPVDFLIKIAESENKQKVLKVLMERKNRILS